MNDFTASNGVIIREHPGAVGVRRSAEDLAPVPVPGFNRPERTQTYLDPRQWEAIAEAVQAETDERLGRWRWPKNPDYVVYPCPVRTRVRVLRETGTGDLEWVDKGDGRSYEFVHAARAYFDAHPEPKPLPTVEGVYAMHPQVHLYERLIMLRGGKWLHLHTSASQFADGPTAEQIARTAVDEGRLTLLVPEVSS